MLFINISLFNYILPNTVWWEIVLVSTYIMLSKRWKIAVISNSYGSQRTDSLGKKHLSFFFRTWSTADQAVAQCQQMQNSDYDHPFGKLHVYHLIKSICDIINCVYLFWFSLVFPMLPWIITFNWHSVYWHIITTATSVNGDEGKNTTTSMWVIIEEAVML